MPMRTSRSRCRGGRSNRASPGSRATRFGSPAVPVAKARAVDRVPAGRWLRWSRTRERDGNDADADADRVPVRRDRGAAMGGGTAGLERAQVVRFQDRATDRGGLPGGDMNPGAISGIPRNPAESAGRLDLHAGRNAIRHLPAGAPGADLGRVRGCADPLSPAAFRRSAKVFRRSADHSGSERPARRPGSWSDSARIYRAQPCLDGGTNIRP